MSKVKQLIWALALMAGSGLLPAQTNVEFEKENFKDRKDELREAKSNIKKGDELYEQGMSDYTAGVNQFVKDNHYIPSINDIYGRGSGAFTQAVDFYKKAQLFNPNNADLNFKIGFCLMWMPAGKFDALSYLEKAYKLNSNVNPDIQYMLGRGYQLSMDLDKAIAAYKAYLPFLNTKAADNKVKIEDVNKKIQECIVGQELMKTPERVFIDNLGCQVNSRFSDYGPLISTDESIMIFTSRRDNSTGGKMTESGEFMEDLYISTYKDGKWIPAKNMGPPINGEEHDATAGLSPDGTTLYIYRFSTKDGGDIWECHQSGDTWTKPERMNKNINSSAHESTVSLSYDGKTLYFVSDKPGGMGAKDIYLSRLDEKGKWGPAENVGPPINTMYSEEAVFIHPDGKTMYFSSQGHRTMGGYDLFKSTLVNGKWTEPVNMGYPVNGPDDDVFFVISGSGRHGYYASKKSDGCGEKDIYKITFLGPEKPFALNSEDNLLASVAAPIKSRVVAPPVEIKTAALTILKGVITDALTGKPLEATIELVDNQRNEVIASFKSNSVSGKYLVTLPGGKNYGIAVKAENYLFHSENFDIPASAAFQEVNKDIALNNLAVGTKIVLRNIFFDFDKSTLRPESTNELERLTKLLQDVPTLKIEISGHTDNKGSADYNQKLSESRAKAVVDYLTGKGITADRLQYKGYGLTQPMAPNDTDEGRQLNRRTEFKVLSK
ncbi:MAG TPA: OmpA family protein [Bacteroidia bacterium]|jgi:outer membrane protein OmpA-like peptidoglycan-associated protein|nr:OmpA family protein [Bacteroidia bacterium]